MQWSAKQYGQFEAARTRPVRDLLAALPDRQVSQAIDLGCGPGNSTEVLRQRYPDATITGLDSSADMLDAARQRLPALHFALADISAWHATAAYDVILANASLQWLPDHETLFPRLLQALTPQGCLAVQMPDNLQEPAHRLARDIAAQHFGLNPATAHPPRHEGAWYYELLASRTTALDIWRTTYLHPMPNHRAVVEWFKGSALLPYLRALQPDAQTQFLQHYEKAIGQAYPALADGSVLLPFPRLFIVATAKP
ncbi:trans-aconitate 2-methyltransferase [Pseudomonas sp. S 311-6]|nr:trans-aconitate 2-methyltransferase [Pseudomonas sp. S 311-6]